MSAKIRGSLMYATPPAKNPNMSTDVKNAIRKTNENVYKWALVKPYNVTEAFTRSIFIHNLKDLIEHVSITKWDFSRFKKLIEIDIDNYGFIKKVYLSVNRYKNIYLVDEDFFESIQAIFDNMSYDALLPEDAIKILMQSKNPGTQEYMVLDLSLIKNFKIGK